MAEDNDLARSDILDADNYEELIDDDDYMVDDDDDDDDMYFNDEVEIKPPTTMRKNSNLTVPSSSGNKSKDCYEFQVNNAQIFFLYFIYIYAELL
jgi:hypothetical protein